MSRSYWPVLRVMQDLEFFVRNDAPEALFVFLVWRVNLPSFERLTSYVKKQYQLGYEIMDKKSIYRVHFQLSIRAASAFAKKQKFANPTFYTLYISSPTRPQPQPSTSSNDFCRKVKADRNTSFLDIHGKVKYTKSKPVGRCLTVSLLYHDTILKETPFRQ